ncbi:hypothetical protein ALI22I_01170 [Saccharothrix sp. ALI-22-I]|uniref:hypothetical protein n=1 Tax=Saccharothrix sp. ALI-22-I TaxID=1933778 RepID=UPI00097C48D5|nr:hypothetical protein [Saccharothrix sp. ALI-22-I]ONI92914.1 hypothetical protein ALI22I_01170 [Saccharothrix sp. ALI-22-I]
MDDLVTQLGLLLTQTRFARRTLEDIERSTAQYGTSAFTSAVTPAAALGSPPLLDGALKVHVVNIRELTPGSGFGDLLSGVFGGVGSFVGNLFGGLVGGTIGSIKLIDAIGTIHSLAGRIERIIDKLGLGKAPPSPVAAPPARAGAPQAAGGQPDFLATLATVRGKFDAVTALLRAAAGGPGAPPSAASAPLGAPDATLWKAWVDSLTSAIDAATRLVGGLIVAVPTAIASVSWLLDRLPDVRDAISDALRFIVRDVLVLRGAVIVLALDTIAMIARVAAMTVRTLAATVSETLTALFAALAKLLDGALQLGGVLGGAVTGTVNELLGWLVPTVDKILRNLGELRIFRVLARLVDVLPALLALTGGGTNPAKPAGTAANPADPARPPLPAPPPPPNLAMIMAKVGADAQAATDRLTEAAEELVDQPTAKLRAGLTTFAEKLDEAAINEVALSGTSLAKRLQTLGARTSSTAEMLIPAVPVRAETGFGPIAAAYGQWLATGGLRTLLDSMKTYFTTPPERSQPVDRQPATERAPVVRIDEVVIDIAPPPAAPAPEPPDVPWGPGDFPIERPDDDVERLARQQMLDDIRGARGRRRPYVPASG